MRQLGDIKFYDVQEVAEIFDMTPQSIRKFFKTGKIKARKIGNKWYVTEESIRAYLLGDEKANEEKR